MEKVIYLSFGIASICFTVTESRLFAPVRNWIKKANASLGSLVFCGYCLGHWLAFALVAIYQPRLFNSWWLLDYFLTAIVIAWLSAIQWILMCGLMDKAGK